VTPAEDASTLDADVAVVGAGVVGLAVARALARAGREVFVIDKERFVGFTPARATPRWCMPASTTRRDR